MLRLSNIFLLAAVILSVCASCKVVPDGVPPVNVVDIQTSDIPGEKISLAEAVNLVSTELAVKFFSGHKGEIKILFKDKPSERAVVRRLYQELKCFSPVKSVVEDEDFVVESVFAMTSDKTLLWQVKLKAQNGKLIWSGVFAIKDGEKI